MASCESEVGVEVCQSCWLGTFEGDHCNSCSRSYEDFCLVSGQGRDEGVRSSIWIVLVRFLGELLEICVGNVIGQFGYTELGQRFPI